MSTTAVLDLAMSTVDMSTTPPDPIRDMAIPADLITPNTTGDMAMTTVHHDMSVLHDMTVIHDMTHAVVHDLSTPPDMSLVGWVAQNSGVSGSTFHGVWGSDANNVWVVGDGGQIIHTTNGGTTWTTAIVGSARFMAIWGSSSSDIYIAGDRPGGAGSGALYHSTDGVHWSSQTAAGYDFRGLWGSSSGDIYLVGYDTTNFTGGGVYHSTGNGSWSYLSNAGSGTWNCVWGSSASNVYVGGGGNNGNGTLLNSTNGGSTWANQTLSGVGHISFIWGGSASDFYFGGNGVGSFYHTTNGASTWSQVSAVSSYTGAPWGTSISNVYVPISTSTVAIEHSSDDGASFQSQPLTGVDSSDYLYSVWGTSDGKTIYAVGANGTIVRKY
jgi:photosystem II stability/assembly factor-like uncharacterized protein